MYLQVLEDPLVLLFIGFVFAVLFDALASDRQKKRTATFLSLLSLCLLPLILLLGLSDLFGFLGWGTPSNSGFFQGTPSNLALAMMVVLPLPMLLASWRDDEGFFATQRLMYWIEARINRRYSH